MRASLTGVAVLLGRASDATGLVHGASVNAELQRIATALSFPWRGWSTVHFGGSEKFFDNYSSLGVSPQYFKCGGGETAAVEWSGVLLLGEVPFYATYGSVLRLKAILAF